MGVPMRGLRLGGFRTPSAARDSKEIIMRVISP